MKKLGVSLGVVVVVLVGLYFFGEMLLGKGIKKGIETFGPKVTQTEVTVGNVMLSPFSGAGAIHNLFLGSPEGFSADKVMSVGTVDIKVDTKNVTTDNIIIESIYINAPEFVYEKTLTNSNVKQLLANIQSFTSTNVPAKKASKEKSGSSDATKKPAPNLEIKKLVIEGAQVTVRVAGTDLTVPMSTITLTNLGKDGKTSATAIVSQVMTAVLKEVTKVSLTAITDNGLTDILKSTGEGTLNTIKGLFGK